MTGGIKIGGKICFIPASLIGLLLIVLWGCNSQPRIYAIGMVNDVSIHEPAVDGFKAGMIELGYIEGKNIRYIYNGVTGLQEASIDAGINEIVSQDVDILLAFGNTVAFRAKHLLEEAGIPIVVVAVASPVKAGLVEDLRHPGGNLTGLQIFDSSRKGLEWLQLVLPEAKKAFLPYDAADEYAATSLESLKKDAAQMGLEIVLHPVSSTDEAVAVIENLPEDIDAIYRVPAPAIDCENSKLSEAAIKHRLPLLSSIPLDEGVLLTYATSFFKMGEQTARLAGQVLKGQKPADLPIETAEVTITVNLKTAERIGLTIPDIVLLQATDIIR